MRSSAIRSAADALSPVSSVPRPAGAPPRLADYELLRQIGAGAYGEVWLGRSTTGALRAVKLVYRASFADERPFLREFEGIQKFEAISRSHPSQLALFHVGRNEAAGCFYYVMELADAVTTASGPSSAISEQSSGAEIHAPSGSALSTDPLITDYSPRTLRSDLATGRLPAALVLEFALALTEALSHLHASGLVHRDIKPSNIIFVNGRPKLADIGLVTGAAAGDDARSIVGTEGYLPPEGPGTPAADLFALGRVLYEALTGFDRRQYPDLPTDLRNWPDRALAFELNEVILRASATDVRERYADAGQLSADLERLRAGGSVRRHHLRQRLAKTVGWALAGSLVVALMVLGGMRLQDSPGKRSANIMHGWTTNQEAADLCEKANYLLAQSSPNSLPTARRYLQEAIRKDPSGPNGFASKAQALYFARRYPEALREIDQVSELRPDLRWNLNLRAQVLSAMGKHAGAIEACESIIEQVPDKAWPRAKLFYTRILAGQTGADDPTFAKLLARSDEPRAAFGLALAYTALGDHPAALTSLETACDRHEADTSWIKVDPRFDPLRGERRFKDLLKRMNLASPELPKPMDLQ